VIKTRNSIKTGMLTFWVIFGWATRRVAIAPGIRVLVYTGQPPILPSRPTKKYQKVNNAILIELSVSPA
jgi:hypothetical protein